jgi:hypothetical protein
MWTAVPSVEVERPREEGTDATAHRERKEEKGHTLAIRTQDHLHEHKGRYI